MKPTVKFDRTLVTVLVDEVVHVMLELAAPPAATMNRAPLDVVVVLDRSGSMSGAPLESVTAATAQLLRLAGSDDRVGVVAFDDEVQLVLPLAHHDPDIASRAVRAIQEGGSTNLSGGWLKGLELLTTAPRAESLRRIIVLTDGHANAGITGADQLVQLIKGGYGQGVTTSCIGFDAGYDEQLLAARLMEKARTKRERLLLVAKEIDEIRFTVFRQTMFAEFERLIHAEAETGNPLTLARFRELYRGLLEDYFGPGTVIDPWMELEGLRIPHFYGAFYVYKYATGLSSAIALARGLLGGGERERRRYLHFLSLGGSKYPLDQLKEAGVDLTTPQPVAAAMGRLSELADELDTLAERESDGGFCRGPAEG